MARLFERGGGLFSPVPASGIGGYTLGPAPRPALFGGRMGSRAVTMPGLGGERLFGPTPRYEPPDNTLDPLDWRTPERPTMLQQYMEDITPDPDVPFSRLFSLMNIMGPGGAGSVSGMGRRGAGALSAALLGERSTPVPVSPRLFEGQAPDRSDFTLLRYEPARGTTARTQTLYEGFQNNVGGIKDKLRAIATEGEEIGRRWYNTEGLRDRFITELGPDAGHDAWREFMWLVGATSPGSKVPANVKNASMFFKNAGDTPDDIVRQLEAGEFKRPKGYGHKTQIAQNQNVAKYYGGDWDPSLEPGVAASKASTLTNPKPRGFANSLLGGTRNIAADLHFTRLMAMTSGVPDFLNTQAVIGKGKYDELAQRLGADADKYLNARQIKGTDDYEYSFKAKQAVQDGAIPFDEVRGDANMYIEMPGDNEYAMFERMMNEMAAEMDMTAPQMQAALWMGAAKQTGVDPTSLNTFEAIFDGLVAKRADALDITPDEMFSRLANREEMLSLTPAPLPDFTFEPDPAMYEETVY